MERLILDHLILSKNWNFKFVWKQTYLLCPLKRLNFSETSTHTSLHQWIDINENFLDLNVFPSQHAGPQSVTLLATFCFTLLMLYLKIKGRSCKGIWLKLKLFAGSLIFINVFVEGCCFFLPRDYLLTSFWTKDSYAKLTMLYLRVSSEAFLS